MKLSEQHHPSCNHLFDQEIPCHCALSKIAQLEAENERLRACKEVFQRFRDFVEKAEGGWLYGENWTLWVDPALGGES